jgi:glutamate-1-semialdehyde aminotransferase
MLNQITNFKNSIEYRKKIHRLIPGGAHTYSKGDDQFPLNSPAAIAYGKGAYVWDIDGNKYLDCSMGLTSISLGHAYEPVLSAVRLELEKGVNFQRPASIEMEMAEKFLELVPCHQMIKFAKNGSTATTAAMKLARAYTGRELVAFPGDHPFYSYDDWFIGKTACDKGVPSEFKNYTVTYNSMDLNTLEEMFLKYPGKVACVISEPEKTHNQPKDYIKKLIEICHKHGALYVMDEMITGFKTDYPGSIKKMGVEPDMATWGKGIANGFSFCALTGKKEIMELGGINRPGEEKVFLISTTHGGETHAMAACLATMNEFKNKNVVAHNHSIGDELIKNVRSVILEKGLSSYIEVSDTNWMVAFTFKNKNGKVDNGYRTLMLQEMIKRGILFQGVFVPCFSHQSSDVELFVKAFNESLEVYIQAIEKGFEKYLIGEPTKPVFRKIL